MRIPDELLPVVEWWEKDGKQTLAIVCAVAVIAAGWYGVKGWREARAAAAGDALLNAESVEELEAAVASYGSSKTGPALKLRLAKAYFDARNFQSAADTYAELQGKAPAGFDDVPYLGAAECLEAQESFDEALKAYDAFVEERPGSPFLFEARLGAVRVLAQNGAKDAALERLAALKEEFKDDDAATERLAATEDLVKRWEKRSLFDAADAIAEALEQVEAPAPAPAPEAATENQKPEIENGGEAAPAPEAATENLKPEIENGGEAAPAPAQ